MRKLWKLKYFFIIFTVLFVATAIYYNRGLLFSPSAPKWPTQHDAELSSLIESDQITSERGYDFLFKYFVTGLSRAMVDGQSRAWYNGALAGYTPESRDVQAMEGFARMAPMIAAWLSSDRSETIVSLDGEEINLIDLLRSAFIAGTSPRSPEYWGNIEDFDQRMVEAADLALTLWMLRERLWNSFSDNQKDAIANWFLSANWRNIYQNNWLLFSIVVNLVMGDLTGDYDQALVSEQYAQLSSLYAGEGWYRDGEDGSFDYYNAWNIHYQLFWIDQILANFDEKIDYIRGEFFEKYKYLIGPKGFPILGRSVCYRMAAAVPALISYIDEPRIPSDVARRYLDATWAYFLVRGAVKEGNVTQGFCSEDLSMLDLYSGPGTCLWSLRSLVIAYYIPTDDPFWAEAEGKLPIEESGYEIRIDSIGWTVSGNAETEEIVIEKNSGKEGEIIIEEYDLIKKIRGVIHRYNRRPANRQWKYEKKTYSSESEICRVVN